MAAQRQFIKWFLDAFDGRSEDVRQMTAAQRWCWVALCAFAREYLPRDGCLNDGTEGRELVPVSVRRLAAWAMVSPSTMSETLRLFQQRGLLKQDLRRSRDCWFIANWEKWQVGDGCSAAEQEGVRLPNSESSECSAPEQECSATEHHCSATEQFCPVAEHLLSAEECSGAEHGGRGGQGTQGALGHLYFAEECSGAEHSAPREDTTENDKNDNDRAREGEPDDSFDGPAAQPPRRLRVDPDPAADNAHEKQGYPCLGSWLHEHCKRWPKLIRDRWLMDILAAIESPSDTWLVDEEQAVALLEEHRPKGAEKNLPAKWLERMEEIVAPKPRGGGVSEYAQKRRVAGPKPGVSGTGWDLLDKILEEE